MHNLLHIYHNGLSQRSKRILSTDKKTTLYTFEATPNHASTPHVCIYTGPSTAQKILGTIDFYGTSIALKLPNSPPIAITQCGSMSIAYHSYKSPAFNERILKWRKAGFWNRGDYVCEDEGGNVIAKLKKSGLSVSKSGTLELGDLVMAGGERAVEEVVVGGVALLELQRKLTRDSMGDVEGGSGY